MSRITPVALILGAVFILSGCSKNIKMDIRTIGDGVNNRAVNKIKWESADGTTFGKVRICWKRNTFANKFTFICDIGSNPAWIETYPGQAASGVFERDNIRWNSQYKFSIWGYRCTQTDGNTGLCLDWDEIAEGKVFHTALESEVDPDW